MASVENLDGFYDSEDEFSLVVAERDGQLLVGRKQRGRQQGRLVLPGGKYRYWFDGLFSISNPANTDAARELAEETGIYVPDAAMLHVGSLAVSSLEESGDIDDRRIDIFRTKVPAGAEARDTDELAELGWLDSTDLPYAEMPADYKLWLPHVLAGYAVHGFIETDEAGVISHTVARQEIEPPGRLEAVS